jgi:hypothetical protein
MRILGLNRPAAIAAAVAVGSVASVVALRHHPPALAALWSAAMIASFVGWGSLANLLLVRERWMDWGLRAGWGMAVFILTGGFLCALHVAIRPVFVVQVGLGVIVLLGAWAHRRSLGLSATRCRWRALVAIGRPGVVAVVAGAYAVAVFTFVAFVGNHWFQPSDDPPFYFKLPENLVQAGSMFEPYAARRASSFGGQVYLHAAFISVASVYYLHLVDAGVSLIIVVSLLVGHVGRAGLRPRHAVPIALAMLVLFTLRNVRVNTASLMSGVAAILTLYRTVRIPLGPDPDRPGWPMEPRRIAALAGLTVVCILLRTSNASAVLPFVAIVLVREGALRTRSPWTRQSLLPLVRAGALFAGVFVLVLLPWSILLKESSGTFFFPFGHSNVTPGWTYLSRPKNFAAEFAMHVVHGRPVLFVPFAVAALWPLSGRGPSDRVALTLASIIGLLAQTSQSAAFGPDNTARYYFAYIAATVLVVAVSVGRDRARAALVAGAVAIHLVWSGAETIRTLSRSLQSAKSALLEATTGHNALDANEARRAPDSPALLESMDHGAFDARTGDYLDLQAHIPPGATMVTAVFEPFRFDFKRNQILLLDFLGGMGPKPGWPFKQGPEALGRYLVANGVQYLAWVDFNLPSEFYNKAHWTTHLAKTGQYLQGEAVFELDAEDSIEKLAAMRHVVYRAHGMTVVDLVARSD